MFSVPEIPFTKPLTYNWDKHNFSINVQQDIDRSLVLKFWLVFLGAYTDLAEM